MGDIRETILNLQAKGDETFLTWLDEDGASRYTFNDLHQRIAGFAGFYRAQDLEPGAMVLIILRESIDLFAAFLGALACGTMPGFFAYPSPKQSAERFLESYQDLIRYNEVRLIVTYPEVADLLAAHPELGIAPEKIALAQQVECRPDLWLPDVAEPTFIQFSSGTTGAKKGVKITSEALRRQIQAYLPRLELNESSKIVSWLPHYHDMGLIACMLLPFMLRLPVVMMSPFLWVRRPEWLLQAISEERGTHCWLPNFALGHLVCSIPAAEVNRFDLSSLQRLTLCSEPVLYDTVLGFLKHFAATGLRPECLANCYAMAENTFAMTDTDDRGIEYLSVDYAKLKEAHVAVEKSGGYPLACAGSPLNNLQIRILDGNKQELPEKNIGEIHIQSDSLMSGYHNNPEATREAFHEGWFNTGDLGFLHEGRLYVTGRKKELLIIGGENIYPQDIEQWANSTPGFLPGRNVVFGIEDPAVGTERVVMLAEAEKPEQARVQIPDLKAKTYNRLGVSLSEVILLPPRTLIKSTAGKISRYLNQQAFLEGRFQEHVEAETGTTADPLVECLRSVVSDPHGLADLSDDTNFYQAGLLDSFRFLQFLQAVEQKHALTIPPTFQRFDDWASLATARRTLASLGSSNKTGKERAPEAEAAAVLTSRESSLRELLAFERTRGRRSMLESLVYYFPFPTSRLYLSLLRAIGIKVGRNVIILGRLHLKLRGKPGNIRIEDNVVLGKEVDLRIRENGRIHLRKGSYLDNQVRLVAAREGLIDVGEQSEIGLASIVNSGGETRLGRGVMIGSYVNLNSSSHGTNKAHFIKQQPHDHGKLQIGDDVWIGAGASVVMNSFIGEGAVIGGNSLVSGRIPDFAVCAGVPAKVLRYRQ